MNRENRSAAVANWSLHPISRTGWTVESNGKSRRPKASKPPVFLRLLALFGL